MSTRAWFSRLGGSVFKSQGDRQLSAELESHLELHIADNIRSGMSPEEARRQALIKLGGVEATKEAYRERRGLPLVEQTLQDVRFGMRMLLKNPGFTVVALLALALGIGANTALFSVVYSVLLRPLPYREGDRLVVVRQSAPQAGVLNTALSVQEIDDYRARSKSMEQLEEFHSMMFILLGPKPDRVRTGVVSHGFFSMLGVQPIYGRNFRSDDDLPNAPAVLLLSNKYWKSMFGGDPNIVGKTVKLNDRLHTIVGVLPPFPQYPSENDVFMPVSACPWRMNKQHLEMRSMRMMGLFGRLKAGVDPAAADAEIQGIASSFVKEFPADYQRSKGFTGHSLLLQDELTKNARPMLWLLLGTTALVLLICCTNVANLALARMMAREHEFGMRSALGASRERLMRQMLAESVLLALGGGLLGLLLASGSIDLLVTFVGRFTTRAAGAGLSAPVLGFTFALAVVTGLAFGMLPALSVRRAPATVMKMTAASTTESGQRHRMRSALIVAQVALCFVMLSGAALMLRTLLKLESVDAGYNSDHVLTARLPFNFTKLKQGDNDTVRAFEGNILRALEGLPGVIDVALTSAAPLDQTRGPANARVVIEGRPIAPNEPQAQMNVITVTPGAFRVLGLTLLRGRLLGMEDGPETPQVAVVSQSVAKHYFPNDDAIGHRISGDNGQHWVKIVGVIGDMHQFGLDKEPIDTAYVPATQQPGTGMVMLRTQTDPSAAVSMLRGAIANVDAEQPVVDIKTLDMLRDESLATTRVTALLLGMFALIALILAATGLAGLTSFLVSQRTREIGIRLALGAQVRQVLGLVLAHGVKLIAAGVVLGAALSVASGRALQQLLFGVKPFDMPSLAAVGAMLIAVSLVASYMPARRATKVQPTVALRCE